MPYNSMSFHFFSFPAQKLVTDHFDVSQSIQLCNMAIRQSVYKSKASFFLTQAEWICVRKLPGQCVTTQHQIFLLEFTCAVLLCGEVAWAKRSNCCDRFKGLKSNLLELNRFIQQFANIWISRCSWAHLWPAVSTSHSAVWLSCNF